jgi:hypothetical protein
LIALGCLGVLVLGGVASAFGAYMFYRRAQNTLEAAGSALAPLVPPPVVPTPTAVPATETATSGAGEVTNGGAPAGGLAAPGGLPTAPAGAASALGGTPSPSCAKAAACCRALVSRTPGGAAALAGNCDNLRVLNDQMCEQTLQSYRQAGRALGVTCD